MGSAPRVFPGMRRLSFCLCGFLFSAFAGMAEEHGNGVPLEFASAVCTRFDWVSDLPLTTNTCLLLQRTIRQMDSQARVHEWSNGSSGDFLQWMQQLKPYSTNTCLILYLATHQKRDGRLKFSEGEDLPPDRLVNAVNQVAERYARVLLVNDSCHAAALEFGGEFCGNVSRFYASAASEEAVDVDFARGPAGLEDFARPGREWLRGHWGWDPPGMSFFGLMGLQAALRTPPRGIMDLEEFWNGILRQRDRYDEQVRQAKVQHPTRSGVE